MPVKVLTATIHGLDVPLVEVEVDAASGLPGLQIVGLADRVVDEARERVRAAIRNLGISLPPRKVTVNLAPAKLPKSGNGFDLPIALGILAAHGLVTRVPEGVLLGELALDGSVRPVNGILAVARRAKVQNLPLFVPAANAREAALVRGASAYPLRHLRELIGHLTGEEPLAPQVAESVTAQEAAAEIDFADIRGQEQVKRALELAASGGHNVLLSGPPGVGKSLLAKAFPGILPPMSEEEMLDVSEIYSIAGLLPPEMPLITARPVRMPHHSATEPSLVGGGSPPHPGEITLAHRGVLFLDEISEFPRSVLEALRQPLEEGSIVVARAGGTVRFPARFILLAASNPCPCGYFSHPKIACTCAPGDIHRYRKRLSGPLLDRIDLHVAVPPVEEAKLLGRGESESSATIRARVIEARKRQAARFHGLSYRTNAEIPPGKLGELAPLEPAAAPLLSQAAAQYALSARAVHRAIRLARTIADLGGAERIGPAHIAEALQYRKSEPFG